MEFVLYSFFAGPMFYIGAVLAGVAALGFVLFISGLLPGVVPALKESAHAEHTSHRRMRAIWGLYLAVAAFVLWRISLWIAGSF
ncbi:MAG TPA: hypothetical protein VJZ94_00670 [Candidatus Paceibacterota bacterium]|nr:hypothetical protein [Candidatus Paceibacterota bacterium]